MHGDVKKFLSTLLTKVSDGDINRWATENVSVNQAIIKIGDNAEKCKGVMTVLITLLTYKSIYPDQDIRLHQASMENGFSGRGFDTIHVTPFLRSAQFPCMAETGWLTRSLEQPFPYTLNYQGKIQYAKIEFLNIIHDVQENGFSASSCLEFLFAYLVYKRDSTQIQLAHPHHLPISYIMSYLENHFNIKVAGSARLPVIAIYSAYACIMQGERYDGLAITLAITHLC